MNKSAKRIGIGFGIAIGLVLLLSGVLILAIYIEIRKMSSLETQKVVDGIYAVQDTYVNLFLIKGDNRYIAIDAGNNAARVQQALDRLQIDPQKVAAVFLTHSDADHIAGLSLFNNAVIYLSAAEEQMINGQTSRFLFLKNKLAYPYEGLEDNQLIDIAGLRVRGHLTPGHTPGSMCYVINDVYLFTGDSMSLKEGKADEFNDLFNMDSKTQQRSLKKLADLSRVKYIFTAHYGYADNYQNAFANWRD